MATSLTNFATILFSQQMLMETWLLPRTQVTKWAPFQKVSTRSRSRHAGSTDRLRHLHLLGHSSRILIHVSSLHVRILHRRPTRSLISPNLSISQALSMRIVLLHGVSARITQEHCPSFLSHLVLHSHSFIVLILIQPLQTK